MAAHAQTKPAGDLLKVEQPTEINFAPAYMARHAEH